VWVMYHCNEPFSQTFSHITYLSFIIIVLKISYSQNRVLVICKSILSFITLLSLSLCLYCWLVFWLI
jgi:hypothetical protein